MTCPAPPHYLPALRSHIAASACNPIPHAAASLPRRFAEHGDLYRRLPDMKQEEGAIVKHVVGPLLSAVAAMHSSGVIHRDMKPENILLQGSHILVSDFGFATTLDLNPRPLTRLGTLHFMAPEMLLNDVRDPLSFRNRIPREHRRPYCPAVDVWALGVIIYECIFHCSPFHDLDESRVTSNILFAMPDLDGCPR